MKNQFYIKIIIAFLFLSSNHAISQIKNEVLLKSVISQLKLKEENINLELVADKILPYETSKTAFVIPEYECDHDESMINYNIFVLIVDNISGKIVNKFYQKNALVSDAVEISGISIDTGLYKLNDKTRAFGFRTHSSNRSGPNPYGEENLFLYIPDGNSLRQVLNEFRIYSHSAEWDLKCAGEMQMVHSTIDIGKNKSHGLADLIVKNNLETTISKGTKEHCVDKKEFKNTVTTLKFDGKEYKEE